MAKMRIFKFWNEAGDEKEKTLCCTHCRCENDEKNDILDIEAFNGA